MRKQGDVQRYSSKVLGESTEGILNLSDLGESKACTLQAVSAEEVSRRRNELAKMRSLLFRHETKAQRLAKIKSKDYHRRINKASRRKVTICITNRACDCPILGQSEGSPCQSLSYCTS